MIHKKEADKKRTFKISDLADKVVERYASFLTSKPLVMLIITIILIVFAFNYSSQVKQSVFEPEDAIPDDIPVIAASLRFSDEFGTIDSVMIVVESEPEASNSMELRDLRHPEIVTYLSTLTQYLEKSEQIKSINNPGTYLELAGDPKTALEVRDTIERNPSLLRFFSEDGTMARIIINLDENFDEDDLIKDMEDAIAYTPNVPGISTRIAGSIVAETLVSREIGPDMSRTSNISLAGIVVVLLLIFGSIRFGLMPLTTIIVGVLWTFGYLGFIGTSINSATSGVLSMIIGIGIDFGIQIITRYRQELGKGNKSDVAMNISLNKTIFPMFITTIAAVIGFASMSMGQLTILKSIGDMMTYGVVFCYLAAITFVPSVILVLEDILHGFKSTLNIYRGRK
ncbi:MMPL family transporter [Candidatus Woesearchaeota archaeon]|nr:MMPL family transporter [Candidatus Woesearchaeota archaeon]